MLSIHTIDRTLESKDYDRLLRELAKNGLVMPLPLRVQLSESPVGAKGLGLRRLVELTFGPTDLAKQLIASLLRAQSPAGAALDAAGRPSCLLTAALASGLARVLRDHASRGGIELEHARIGYDRAISALSSMQDGDALFTGSQDRAPGDRLLTTSFIAYLLMDAPGFAERCQGHALLSALEDQLDQANADAQQLIGMARLARLKPTATPQPVQPTPAEPASTKGSQLLSAA